MDPSWGDAPGAFFLLRRRLQSMGFRACVEVPLDEPLSSMAVVVRLA